MNAHDPDEFAPLSYGAAMAVGLLLILGLPTDFDPTRRENRARPASDAGPRAPLAVGRTSKLPPDALEAPTLRVASRP